MKIKNEHYFILEKACLRHITSNQFKAIANAAKTNPRVNSIRKAAVWACFWQVKPYLPRDFVSSTLYDYLNDTHINTALNKIYASALANEGITE